MGPQNPFSFGCSQKKTYLRKGLKESHRKTMEGTTTPRGRVSRHRNFYNSENRSFTNSNGAEVSMEVLVDPACPTSEWVVYKDKNNERYYSLPLGRFLKLPHPFDPEGCQRFKNAVEGDTEETAQVVSDATQAVKKIDGGYQPLVLDEDVQELDHALKDGLLDIKHDDVPLSLDLAEALIDFNDRAKEVFDKIFNDTARNLLMREMVFIERKGQKGAREPYANFVALLPPTLGTGSMKSMYKWYTQTLGISDKSNVSHELFKESIDGNFNMGNLLRGHDVDFWLSMDGPTERNIYNENLSLTNERKFDSTKFSASMQEAAKRFLIQGLQLDALVSELKTARTANQYSLEESTKKLQGLHNCDDRFRKQLERLDYELVLNKQKQKTIESTTSETQNSNLDSLRKEEQKLTDTKQNVQVSQKKACSPLIIASADLDKQVHERLFEQLAQAESDADTVNYWPPLGKNTVDDYIEKIVEMRSALHSSRVRFKIWPDVMPRSEEPRNSFFQRFSSVF
jgi:hypothetical protein